MVALEGTLGIFPPGRYEVGCVQPGRTRQCKLQACFEQRQKGERGGGEREGARGSLARCRRVSEDEQRDASHSSVGSVHGSMAGVEAR